MELHSIETITNEIGLSQVPGIFSGQYNRRLECLCACLDSSKAWIDLFMSIPPAQYITFPASVYSQMSRCFIALYRLTTFEHPEWDRRIVLDTLDMFSFLEEAEGKFMQVAHAGGHEMGEDPDFFNIVASKFRIMKAACSAVSEFIMSSENIAVPANEGMGDFPMASIDEDWLKDLLGPWSE